MVAGSACALALITSLAVLWKVIPGDGERRDAFGITHLKASLPGGMEWTSDWGNARRFDGADPQDPWFDSAHGAASYRVQDGQLFITGPTPRMYIRDPELERQWRNVEVTVYFKRVADEGVPYAGMVAVARSAHGRYDDDNDWLCDTRGVGARLRYDGNVDFTKETAHPAVDVTASRVYEPGGLPKQEWIGFKYLVYDHPEDAVVMELWVDRTEGVDGGDWTLVNRAVDNGRLFGKVPCAEGVRPSLALTNDPVRVGSESGKPNLDVYLRSDGVLYEGLVYKWASVRETVAEPAQRD